MPDVSALPLLLFLLATFGLCIGLDRHDPLLTITALLACLLAIHRAPTDEPRE